MKQGEYYNFIDVLVWFAGDKVSSPVLPEHQAQDETTTAAAEVTTGSTVEAKDGRHEHDRKDTDSRRHSCDNQRGCQPCQQWRWSIDGPTTASQHRSQTQQPDTARQRPTGC